MSEVSYRITTQRHRTRHLLNVFALAGAVLAPGVRAAATTDLTVEKIEVTQGIQDGNGNNGRTLVQGRETIARVYVNSTEADVAGVDAILHVQYPSGDPDSHSTSLNGPIVANGGTNSDDWDHTVNFCFVARETGSVQITATVNPDGAVPETDDTNNDLSISVDIDCVDPWSVGYVRVDYLGRGLPDDDLIKPGVGDAFILASFPLAHFDYHRAGSSLSWDQDVASDFTAAVLKAYLAIYRITHDESAEQVYAWLTGSISSNGSSTPLGNVGSAWAGESLQVAYGNTQDSDPDRYQRTFAHEMGHNLRGAGHDSLNLNWTGIDAYNLLGLGHTRPKSLVQLMAGGRATDKAWVKDGEWQTFYNHPQISCGGAAAATAGGGDSPSTLVAGLYYPETDTAQILEIFEFETGGIPLTADQPTGTLRLELTLSDDTLVGFVNFEPAECPSDSENPPLECIRPFAVVLEPQGVKMKLKKATTGDLLDIRVKSNDPPTGSFIDLPAMLTDGMSIDWTASDPDGDSLSYLLRWSADGTNWTPLTLVQDTTSAIFRGSELPGTVGATGRLQLLISDGFITTAVNVINLTYDDRKAPEVHIIGPRDGSCVPAGASMHLRGSAYDAEDGLLSDSIIWTSSVDGNLGTGEVLQLDTLSAGGHEICAEATDSDTETGMSCIALCVAEHYQPPFDAAFKFNEIYIAHLPPEDSEFIEVAGEPLAPLAGMFVLTVIGGGPNPGVLFSARNLAPADTMPGDGYLVIGDSTTPNVDLLFTGPSLLPNETLTFYLIQVDDPMAIPALVGTDLDADDNGVLDTPIGSLGTVFDVVSVRDGDPADFSYAVPVLGPSGALLPPGVFRPCDWPAPWSRTDFLNADPAATMGFPPTPGSRNTGCPPCPGDINGDGVIGVNDFLSLLAAWGPCSVPCPPSCPADLNGDCMVGVSDFLSLLAAWGPCP